MSGRSADRFLTTVLMTDMVASTQLAAELGDRGWRELVQLHNALVRGALRRHDGREMDTAGDGFFAVFDAPGRSPLDAPDEGPADAAPPGLWVDGGTAAWSLTRSERDEGPDKGPNAGRMATKGPDPSVDRADGGEIGTAYRMR